MDYFHVEAFKQEDDFILYQRVLSEQSPSITRAGWMGATPTHTQTLAANGHWKQLVPVVRSFGALSSNS